MESFLEMPLGVIPDFLRHSPVPAPQSRFHEALQLHGPGSTSLRRPKKPIYLYYLRDPRTNAVRYIGLAADPQQRFRQHLDNPGSALMKIWFQDLRIKKLRPVLEVDEEPMALGKAKKLEAKLIRRYTKAGHFLLNIQENEHPASQPDLLYIPMDHNLLILIQCIATQAKEPTAVLTKIITQGLGNPTRIEDWE